MILNCSYLKRKHLLSGHVKIKSQLYRYVWEKGSSSKVYDEKEKKIVDISDISLKIHNTVSYEKDSGSSVITDLNLSAAAKSLELAISECFPQSERTVSTYPKRYDFEVNKIEEQKFNCSSNSYVKRIKNSNQVTRSLNGSTEVMALKLKNSTNKSEKDNTGPRLNEVNIQMLSKGLFQHLFGNIKSDKPSKEQVLMAQKELEKHGLLSTEKTTPEDISFKLPPLEGGSLQSHFQIIGEQQSRPYRILLHNLIQHLPEAPKEWVFQPGWTKYCTQQSPQSIPFPDDDALVFDVEVCRSAGDMPTVATAASPNAWYAWVSDSLFRGNTGAVARHYSIKDLIPLESNRLQKAVNHGIDKPRVVVGHNVSYDRARVKEQYWLEGTGMRFVDTMSLHICVSGVTSYQRALLKSAVSNNNDETEQNDAKEEEWRNYSSLNSLSEVHKLYCGTALDKTTRDVFVNGDLHEVSNQFQNVMHYCAGDVIATHSVLQQLLPLFLSRFPHPVTLAGMLELSTAYLPVNSNWDQYIADAEQTFEDLDGEGRFLLARRADEACQMLHENSYTTDLWMWDQDWSIQELKLKKSSAKKSKSTERKENVADNITSTVDVKERYEESQGKEIENGKNEHTSLEMPYGCKEESIETEETNILQQKFQYLMETKELLPAKIPHLPGYPAWYRKLCRRPSASDWTPGPQLISTAMQVTPKLLCLTWESYPLHYIRGHGWGFLVPYCMNPTDSSLPKIPIKQLLERCPIPLDISLTAGSNESEIALSNLYRTVESSVSRKAFSKRKMSDDVPSWYKGNGIWCDVNLENCCWFLKLPHKDGTNHRVGNPLAKDFLNKFSDNVLAGADAGAEKVLAIGRMLSYWRNNRERIQQQLVVWLSERDLPRSLRNLDKDFGAIIPQVVVCGTLTRRAVEPTWMTASNAHRERIGSELRAMVQAPPGYSIVGADVDSQELWIASLIGDSHFAKIHGATPFGWMTLSGRKADGTDMHSVTAKAVGISRDHAKVINYARIYGAGQQFAERLLKQFNPAMSDIEARTKATKMFTMTKGKRKYRLKEHYCDFLEDKLYTMREALKLRGKHGVDFKEMFEHSQWTDGTESAMFNRLEEIANSEAPATPFLGGRLSRALEPKGEADDHYLPTRVNWVVQSGAVDFLHLMLVSMRWLLDSQARFCISFHDEVRYLVPDEQKYQAALALHVTNLLARAFCASQLGLIDLPQSVAFFASVEVDTVLRKEAHHDCSTPSNPHGLSKGYGIAEGESLDIYQSLQKAGGTLKAASRRFKKRPMDV